VADPSARNPYHRGVSELSALQYVTDAALAYLPQDELLEELLSRITDVLSADTAAILLLDEGAGVMRAHAARGIEEEVEQGVQIPLGRGFAGRIAAERQPIAIDDIDRADIFNPILREKGIRSLLGVPLLVEGRVIGVLHVGSLTPRHFTSEERDLLQLTGDRAAVAIEHARLYEQRRLAEALQRRLLPSDLGRIPGIELATRYLPASGESLGGDWYDVFGLSRGRFVVAVGDVVGHGLAAAAVMAQLRTALRAYAAEGHPPAEVVARVNDLMWNLGPTAMTTLAYALLDPDEESLALVTAGHLPPLVIDPGGAASFLPLHGGMALGTSRVARYECRVHPFPTGTTVVLYTDGLVESRGRPIDEGLERLRVAAAAGFPSLEALCSGIVERLVPEQRPDDIAVMAARVLPQPERLSASWPAHRDTLVAVRQLLRRWLRARSATEDEIYDITVACQEACANAVEHAYRPGRETFEVEATFADGRVRVTVRDHGRWRAPRGSNRGRGLPLMHALMERVDVEHTEEGTVVVLERTLGATAA
jgi:serine phosphatase RsbU (regulator of sigma subunit)/anti-sigma regulatory factor (Ser/Thr protein kinase)